MFAAILARANFFQIIVERRSAADQYRDKFMWRQGTQHRITRFDRAADVRI